MLTFFRQLPYSSLVILLITYLVFGWEWFSRGQDWSEQIPLDATHFYLIFWSILVLITVIVVGLMTAPLAALRLYLLTWFDSDTRSFFAIMFTAFMGVVLLMQFTILLELMILLAAVTLVRLELQDRKFHPWSSFWILLSIALVGLSLGSLGHWQWEVAYAIIPPD